MDTEDMKNNVIGNKKGNLEKRQYKLSESAKGKQNGRAFRKKKGVFVMNIE